MAFSKCIRFPALDMSAAGNLYADSEITWDTPTTPAGTAVTVRTSLDGVNFSTATSGAAVPGLSLNDDISSTFLTVTVELTTSDPLETPIFDASSLSIEIEANEAALPGGDDFYNEGHLLWTSGNNNARAMEIKDWVDSTRTLTLYLPMARDVQVGDTFEALPGCNKTLAVCIAKFANSVNFRGEPYTPGNDLLLQIPDSQSV